MDDCIRSRYFLGFEGRGGTGTLGGNLSPGTVTLPLTLLGGGGGGGGGTAFLSLAIL
ncbi:hypothetical protein [Desulfogranum marinum]|uniref:hypothetical protein n=1 Tax=Desulfogranum marinum TaxID=453220 RepID=UPI0029C80947|nr:hypothetical protein [Desulfogranum marinum]